MNPHARNILIGAGLGRTLGGLSDWLARDEDNPDSSWDGALFGAALGGYAGHLYEPEVQANRPEVRLPSRTPNRAPLGPVKLPPSGPVTRTVDRDGREVPANSLAAYLPEGYRDEAQAAAEAYRKLNPGIPFKQDISDKAIDRPVLIVRGKPVSHSHNDMTTGSGSASLSAVYDPNRDQITAPPGDDSALSHELTHAAQPFPRNVLGRPQDDSRNDKQPDHVDAVANLARQRRLPSSVSSYLTNPREEEAFLADIKRHYFQATGKRVTDPESARKAIEWRMKDIQSPNPHGREPDGKFPLMDALLHNSQQSKSNSSDRDEWIRALIKKLPGLVFNPSSAVDKVANFPGANTMTPTPNMGGFMGGLPAGNNFSRTFQPSMPPLPQKPNQLAAAPPVQSMKADANGIQTAMAKRGSQDNSAKRISATGESKGVGYKLDDDGHTTGGSAFSTLDKYMKKAGLNSFQTQFFGRLIQAGMNEAQLRHAVKQAQAEFGPAVSQELHDGLEKLASLLGSGLSAGWKALKPIGNKALDYVKPMARKATNLVTGNTATGAITGATNPYTGLMSEQAYNEDGSVNWRNLGASTAAGAAGGRMAGRAGFGDLAKHTQNKMMGGAAIGQVGAEGANALGYDVDPTRAAQIGGAGAFLPGRAGRIVANGNPLDPENLASAAWNNRKTIGNVAQKARTWANANPVKTVAMAGTAAAAPYAGNIANTATNYAADKVTNSLMQRPEVKGVLDNANSVVNQMPQTVQTGIQEAGNRMMNDPRVQGLISNVNTAVSPFVGSDGSPSPLSGIMSYLGLGGQGGGIGSQIGNLIKNNPELVTSGLLSALGMGGGYMLGGRGGAAMGGLSLPLMHYLAQQYSGGAPAAGGAPPAGSPAERQAIQEKERENTQVEDQLRNPLTVSPEAIKPENEIVRQKQQQAIPGWANQSGGLIP